MIKPFKITNQLATKSEIHARPSGSKATNPQTQKIKGDKIVTSWAKKQKIVEEGTNRK